MPDETEQSVSGTINTTRRDYPEAVHLSRRSLGKKEINKIYEKDRAFKAPKLTWNKPDRIPVNPDEMVRGEWLKYMPYAFYQGYVYQNGKLMNAGGVLVDLEDVPEKDLKGNPLRSFIVAMMANHDEQAILADPALCKFCRRHSAADADDYTRHMVIEHPEEILKMSGDPVVPRELVDPDKPLECCGRTFKNSAGLSGHLRFSHQGNPLHP